MKISTLACLGALLYPLSVHAATSPNQPQPASSEPADRDDDEILHRHSIYTGIRLAFDTQDQIDSTAASSLTDRNGILQSLLKHIDDPEDMDTLRQSFPDLDKEYTEALEKEQIEYDRTFLQKNAERPGVVTLPIGIQYEVIADPGGDNRSIDEMDEIERSATLGFSLGGVSGSPGIAVNDLPPILSQTSVLQNLPKGREWKLYIPVGLLPPDWRTTIEKESKASVLICTIRQKPGDNEPPRRALPDPATQGTYKHLPADLCRRYGETQGALIAAGVRSLLKEYPAADIAPAPARQAFLEHIGKNIDADALEKEYAHVILRYNAIHQAREKERDECFIKENAGKPETVVLGNGIQYTVEKDPEGLNIGIDSVKQARLSTISGSENLFLNGFDLQEIFGDAAGDLPPGRKWTAYIPWSVLDESQKNTLEAVWDTKPAYVVFTCEAGELPDASPGTDPDIEDDAPAPQPAGFPFTQPPPPDAQAVAMYENEFLRLNALTPNTVVLDNGVQYSYILDPDGHNGAFDDVDFMVARTLSGKHLDAMGSLKQNVGKAYFHPSLWPYLAELPKAKKWFFYIPATLTDPRKVAKYEQETGVRPNYILYTCETPHPDEKNTEQEE